MSILIFITEDKNFKFGTPTLMGWFLTDLDGVIEQESSSGVSNLFVSEGSLKE